MFTFSFSHFTFLFAEFRKPKIVLFRVIPQEKSLREQQKMMQK